MFMLGLQAFIFAGWRFDLPPGMLPGPSPKVGDAPGTRYYEIPLVIQDRSFYKDGSLFYPDNRAFFEGVKPSELKIDFAPKSDVPPLWNPEFFANTMVVNGRTWPVLAVEPRRYRFRFLNGGNSRFLMLKMVTDPLATEAGGCSTSLLADWRRRWVFCLRQRPPESTPHGFGREG